MTWSFTAAAERAIAEAAVWNSHDDCDDLHTPELLLGLLAQPECRAAEILLARGIDAEAIHRRWPALRRCESAAISRREFSPAVLAVFETAVDRLWEYPRPLLLATEHILLGLSAAPGEVGEWLVAAGFDPRQLEEQIHRLYGHDPGPLPLEEVGSGESAVGSEEGKGAEEETTLSRNVEQGGEERRTPAVKIIVVGGTPPAVSEAAASSASLWRVIDAGANRAREGLRVIEDYTRLVLDDRFLTTELKRLRHDLHAALTALVVEPHDLLASRDTVGDVGTTVSTSAEFARADAADVAAANWKRLEEALRSLEEFTKIVQPAVSATIEQLRYRAYTLERAAGISRTSVDRLAGIRLCVLIDGLASDAAFTRLVDALVAGGTHMIQLRDKKLTDRELLGRARLLRERTAAAGALTIINDRPDIAASVHADGVHVGLDDLPVAAARVVVGPRGLVGASTHSIEQARQAVIDGADYIGVGPTFHSTTKEFSSFTGVELLREVAAEIRLPTFAIGGITLDNLAAVQAAGISRVALSGAVAGAADPAAAAGEFVRRLGTRRG